MAAMPNPGDYDDKDAFLDACISAKVDEGDENEQAVAACNAIWEDHVKANDGMKTGTDCGCGCGGACEQTPTRQHAHTRPVVNVDTDSIRTETFDGRTYRVAPVVAADAEVVMNGAMVPVEEWQRSLPSWNGRPLPVNHPEINGQPISANDPHVLERSNVGYLFNARLEDGKFKAEIWIDEDKANRIAPDVLNALDESRLEVSTAYFADDEPTQGEHAGVPYNMVHRNLRPDHLALLPNTAGACSWEDGCGAPRLNAGADMTTETSSEGTDPAERTRHQHEDALTDTNSESRMSRLAKRVVNMFRAEQAPDDNAEHGGLDTRTLEQRLDRALSDESDALIFVETVFTDDGVVIFERMDTSDNGEGEVGLFRREYSVNDDGTVTLGGVAEPVNRVVQYTTVSNEAASDGPATSSKEGAMDQRIRDLIDNERTPFVEADAETLQAFESDRLDAIVNKFAADDTDTDNTPAAHSAETVDQFIENAPADLQDSLRAMKRQHDTHREQQVEVIMANDQNSFSREELNAMSSEYVDKLAGMARQPSYAARGDQTRDQHQNKETDAVYGNEDRPTLSGRFSARRAQA